MTDRPILFNAPMVRAILSGAKTQTRRPLRVQPDFRGCGRNFQDYESWGWEDDMGQHVSVLEAHNGFEKGDRLYVRETFATGFDLDENDRPVGSGRIWYRADGFNGRWLDRDTDGWRDGPPWTPSIHMPRAVSRITLTVTDVRVQRLQDISCADSIAEGVCPAANTETIDCDTPDPRQGFRAIWNAAYGDVSWDLNPWVAAISFDVTKQNIDRMTA